MSALGLGLIAALCWGVHDFSVRYLKDSVPLLGSLMVVLAVGTLFQCVGIGLSGAALALPTRALGYAVAAGGCFLVADLALYAAFRRGPVALVAPLVASYPVLSVGFAIWRGTEISAWQWLAVVAIVLGVGAASGRKQEVGKAGAWKVTVALSLLGAAGFASTFALGQHAAEFGAAQANLVTRLTALVGLLLLILVSRQVFWPGKRALPLLVVMGVLDGVALQNVLDAGGLPNAEYAAVSSSIFGMLTVVLAWAILRERMTGLQWVGCVLAFAGIGALAL
ncbi:EamA family transporter [Pseudophaeobacter sp.]|uniref:EamA family transporter n=1 Tax=Pseudophaeobacter sp. TaxID=1971739 RepID=UPI00405915A2